ncbi:MAG: phosphohistidine phosphatase SixA [Verrucomicrobiota bacterium]
MLLYLIRHAEAVDTYPDHSRALSTRGRHQTAVLAHFLQRTKAFRPAQVWHSPLLRAKETAQVLLHELPLAVPVKEVPNITPEDDPREIAQVLADMTHPLALVGHEPHLSALASLLVAGTPQPVLFAMKKGATLALEYGGGARWVVRWHVEPDLLT